LIDKVVNKKIHEGEDPPTGFGDQLLGDENIAYEFSAAMISEFQYRIKIEAPSTYLSQHLRSEWEIIRFIVIVNPDNVENLSTVHVFISDGKIAASPENERPSPARYKEMTDENVPNLNSYQDYILDEIAACALPQSG
jgi:hypothetical protein